MGLTISRTRLVEGGTQEAVALTPADGESLTGNTQSNFADNGFWTRNGYSRAADWTGTNPLGSDYTGFDDPRFIPIATWLTDFGDTSFYSRMDDLGINGMLPCAGSIDLDDLVTFENWAVVTDEAHAGGTITSGQDPAVIGISTGEEPGSDVIYETDIDEALAWLATADGPGRFHFYNFADPLLNNTVGLGGVYTSDDMVICRTDTVTNPDPCWISCDQYWFAGAPDDAGGSQTKLHFRMYINASGTPTTAQTARGSHYGSMLDCIRKEFVGPPTNMVGIWIENGAPYTDTTSAAITPAQLKWAVWATLVHGARSIHYFNHTFRDGDPGASSNNLNDDFYGGPGVPGTGIYAATKTVNLQALEVAEAINGPFDGYFVFGDDVTGAIADSGFLTAVTSTNSRDRYAGVEACCKWAPLEAKHYILSTTREAEATTNIPVTFRMVDQGQTTATELVGDTVIGIERGGGIPGGFCEFDDTFANGASYKSYRID